jgi:hypothetical protein
MSGGFFRFNGRQGRIQASGDQYLQQEWQNLYAMLALYFAWYDFARHSYPNGYEWLLDHHRQLWRDIQTIIAVRGML